MRKSFTLLAAGAIVFWTTAATAASLPVQASLDVAIGSLPQAGFTGEAGAASSAGVGGAATLPAGSLSGIFQTAINPPLLTLLDGVGVAAPGIANSVPFAANALPATNNPLAFDGATGTMSLNASAYLLMAGNTVAGIPLAVVGVGGTEMFHVLSLVTGVINANPYQLGMLTLMGSLNNTPHTLVATGVDNRTAGGGGTLVLVSPTNVNLGILGQLAAIAVLTLEYEAPEPSSLLATGAAVTALVGLGLRRKRA